MIGEIVVFLDILTGMTVIIVALAVLPASLA
jgi:hypothetical protein